MGVFFSLVGKPLKSIDSSVIYVPRGLKKKKIDMCRWMDSSFPRVGTSSTFYRQSKEESKNKCAVTQSLVQMSSNDCEHHRQPYVPG